MEINMTELRVAADELEIDLDNLVPAIEEAILNAYLKQPGAIKGAYVRIDRRNGEMNVYAPELDENDQPTGEYFDDTPPALWAYRSGFYPFSSGPAHPRPP